MALRDFSQFHGCAGFFLVFSLTHRFSVLFRMAMRDSQFYFFLSHRFFFVFFFSPTESQFFCRMAVHDFFSFMAEVLATVLGYCLKVICFSVLITWLLEGTSLSPSGVPIDSSTFFFLVFIFVWSSIPFSEMHALPNLLSLSSVFNYSLHSRDFLCPLRISARWPHGRPLRAFSGVFYSYVLCGGSRALPKWYMTSAKRRNGVFLKFLSISFMPDRVTTMLK
jgi:hypothetical protein